ncbi:hypothetical protein WT82_30030 [Burkholderia stagnalis]|nr:hypothetical protein WT82_30030 [Burkholderia stagnalis]
MGLWQVLLDVPFAPQFSSVRQASSLKSLTIYRGLFGVLKECALKRGLRFPDGPRKPVFVGKTGRRDALPSRRSFL